MCGFMRPLLRIALFVCFSGVTNAAGDNKLRCNHTAAEPAFPRLLINSHASYAVPLTQLIDSLASIGFQDFCRIVVVVGGSTADESPVVGASGVMIHTTLNAHDYTALAMVHRHASHVLVAAPVYMLIHDTSLVLPSFLSFWAGLLDFIPRPAVLFMYPEMQSNVFPFRSEYIALYGDAFNKNLTKMQALDSELNGLVQSFAPGPLTTFAPHAREHKGVFDVYGTGAPRTTFLYDLFGVYKVRLHAREGAGCHSEHSPLPVTLLTADHVVGSRRHPGRQGDISVGRGSGGAVSAHFSGASLCKRSKRCCISRCYRATVRSYTRTLAKRHGSAAASSSPPRAAPAAGNSFEAAARPARGVHCAHTPATGSM